MIGGSNIGNIQAGNVSFTGMIGDQYFDNTVLLIPGNYTNGATNNTFIDESTNNFAITRVGNPTQGSATPFNPNGFSRRFNAGNDTFNFNNIITGWGNQISTVECWVYVPPLSEVSQVFGIIKANACVAANGRYYFYIDNTTQRPAVGFTTSPSTGTDYFYSTGITTNAWNHIAWTIDPTTITAATIKIYLNGIGQTFGPLNMSTQTSMYTQTPEVGMWLSVCSNAGSTGYISDLRIVKNNLVYTSNFIPPVKPLTTSGSTDLSTNTYSSLQGINTNWSSSDCVILLYPASKPSPNNIASGGATLTRNTSSLTDTVPWSPYDYDFYRTTDDAGSGTFDGTGDGLDAGTNASTFISATGDFTCEAWVYPNSFAGPQYSCPIFNVGGTTDDFLLRASVTAANSTSINVYGIDSTGAPAFGGSGTSSTANLFLHEWSHVAFCRDAGVLNVWINGTRVLNSSSFTSIQLRTTNGGLSVGRAFAGTSPNWNGLIAGAKWTSGAALYSGATITVPTAPPTTAVSSGTCQFLCNFKNAGVFDATMKNNIETAGNAQISTNVGLFNQGSLAFDGTGDYLTILELSNIFQQLRNGNFTVELWLYLTSLGAARGLIGKGDSTNGWLLSINASNQLVFTFGSSTITVTSPTIAQNTWTNVAVTREGTSTNQTRLWIGGNNYANGTVATSFTQTNPIYVGANRTAGDNFIGYIQDVRVTRGIARYTANYTVSTEAYPTF